MFKIVSFDSKQKAKLIKRKKKRVDGNFLIGEINPGKKFSVYLVPIQLLTANPYNSRFKSQILSSSHDEKDSYYFGKKGQEEIKDWIFEQNPIKNRETIKDIKEKGQQTPGLITADGLIINGNRRFTLIQKLYEETKETTKFANFRTVILDEVFSYDHQKIQELENKTQFGKDKTLDYNKIDKMLAICNYKKNNPKVKDREIKEFFQLEDNIKQLFLTMEYINDYLDFFEFGRQYKFVDGMEDQFKKLSKRHNDLENDIYENEIKVDWKPKDLDLEDFKYVFFKFLRFRPSQNKLRAIISVKNNTSIFSYEKVWKDFKQHVENLHEWTVKGLQSKEKNLNKKLGVAGEKEFFEKKHQEKFEQLTLEMQLSLSSKRNKNMDKPILRKLEAVVEDVEDFIRSEENIVKDSFRKEVRKNSQKLLSLIESVS